MHKSHLAKPHIAKPHLIAEWVLARMSSNDRASEIIGDLLEQQKSPTAFYFAITRIAFAMSWRWMLATPAAMLSAIPSFMLYGHFVVEPHLREIQQDVERLQAQPHLGIQHLPAPLPMQIGGYILICGICFWTVASLALFRYGLRSPITRLGGLLSILFTSVACTVWLPHALVTAPISLTLIVALLLLHPPFRRPLFCIAATGLSFAGAFAAFTYAASLIDSHIRASQIVAWLDFSMLVGYLTCIVATAWVLTRTHRWLLSHSESPYA